jgi:ankyrin repeat protein
MVTAAAQAADLRLVDAARRQDRTAARTLVDKVDVNITQPDGATALLWAAQWDDLQTAELLIQAGAKVNAENDYGVAPISLASTNGSKPMIEMLLNAGADPNHALPGGETALMAASRTGRVEAVRELVERGADVGATERTMGQTALMWALSERHVPAARALIAHGASVHDRSSKGFSPIFFAARQGDLDAVTLLLANGADVNDVVDDGTSVLHMATVRGHVELAEFLMDQGANPNASGPGYTPLHWAAGTWETATTRDYSVGEWESMIGLNRESKPRLITELLARGADPNARTTKRVPRFGSSAWKIHGGARSIGATPFFFAASVADIDTMRLLISHGADPLMTTGDDTTTLMAAAGLAVEESETLVPESRHLEAVEWLVELGSEIRAVNGPGDTALHAAAFVGYNTVAKFLLDGGAELNLKNKQGLTPYKIASGIVVTMMFFQHASTADFLRALGGVE